MLKSAQIADIIRPIVVGLGFDLWGCEYIPQGKYSLLRIYIESENGITIDNCKQVSDEVGAVLETQENMYSQYTLEVSSPGIYRLLFTLEQFGRYIGHEMSVRVRTPIEGQRNFKGTLLNVIGEQIVLNEDNKKEVILPFAEIEKASLV